MPQVFKRWPVATRPAPQRLDRGSDRRGRAAGGPSASSVPAVDTQLAGGARATRTIARSRFSRASAGVGRVRPRPPGETRSGGRPCRWRRSAARYGQVSPRSAALGPGPVTGAPPGRSLVSLARLARLPAAEAMSLQQWTVSRAMSGPRSRSVRTVNPMTLSGSSRSGGTGRPPPRRLAAGSWRRRRAG